ncbi:ATP-binding protein [Seohaeicola zhoushanensis]
MDERIFDYRQSQWRDVNGELRRTILLLDITEQEEHVAQIKETEKRWNLALKGAQIGVFDLDVTTGKSVVSDSWRRIMDVELEPDDFNPQSVFIDRVHPDDYKRLRASDDACLRGETVRSSCHYRVRFGEDEWRWMHSDGTVVDWDSNGRALRFVGAQTDVTEQMIAQNALALSEERFRLVFFHAPVGKAIAEGKYYFTAVNEAMCKFLGYTEEELLTKIRLRDVLDCEDLADIYNEIDLRREAGESSMQAEKQFILRDGTRGWGLISISWTMDESLGDLLFIVQINDISEIKEMERTKSEFVSTISHELRTPLTSIRGSLELMASAELAEFPDKRKRLLDIARQNSDRLLRLINDVLDLERIESRRFEFAHYDEDADELLTESCEINSPFAVKLNVSLEIAQLTGGATVSVDRNRFGQVMTNLISNACKFSDPAGTVRIGAEIEGGFVRFWVNNRGPGIPDSFRARVFTPFSQADGTDTRRVGGTGLGLNIAKQIVERMGGTIGFTSVVNEETTFWFTCPLSEEATADQRQVAG